MSRKRIVVEYRKRESWPTDLNEARQLVSVLKKSGNVDDIKVTEVTDGIVTASYDVDDKFRKVDMTGVLHE